MPVEIDNIAVASVASPIAPITSSLGGMETASKKMAEMSLKAKKAESDDPTDDDVSPLFELVKIAIQNGAQVTSIDLTKFVTHFQEEAKLKTKKYTSAKVVSFFTGGTFTFLIYLAFEFFKTL